MTPELINKLELMSKEDIIKYLRANMQEKLKDRKIYYNKNIDKIKKNRSKYYEARRAKVECECGGRYTKQNRSLHFKTKIHLDFLAESGEPSEPPAESLNA